MFECCFKNKVSVLKSNDEGEDNTKLPSPQSRSKLQSPRPYRSKSSNKLPGTRVIKKISGKPNEQFVAKTIYFKKNRTQILRDEIKEDENYIQNGCLEI